ncbi:MAG: hypothetical protein KIT84_10095 [Labilithrix sp.]|nr:hypothetical protein [Labilithrix sp.]MCW5811354.1 hypothetical protein [Labilithrix sp.]
MPIASVFVATTDRALRAELEALSCTVVDAVDPELDLAFVEDAGAARELSPRTKVVVVLPAGDDGDVVRHVRLGAFDFVRRPLDRAELRAVVERALEHRWSRARRIEEAVANDRLVAVAELAGGVAHEIASPLTYLLGNAHSAMEEIARPGFDPSELRAMLDDIKEGAERIGDITRDLRVLSRGATAEPFDTGDVVRSALRIAGSTMRASLEVGAHVEGPAPVRGSPGRLAQAFLHLFVNAAQAAKTTGKRVKLDVGVKRDGDAIVATVRDEGPGMPPPVLARVFDAFFTTRDRSGLGLFLTRAIVREHGGSIDVTSEAGRGATFVVRLPAA